MPKLGIDIENNIASNVTDFKKLDKSVNKVGTTVDNTSAKIKGMGDGLKKALGAFAIGSAIQKGISIMADDISKAAENTLKNNRSSAQLFGQLGIEGVQRARTLATSEGFDISRAQQLINDISSGSSAAGVSELEQRRLATIAIRGEKAVGIPADVTSSVGTQLFNAAPSQFAVPGGAVAATNLARGIGRLGDLPRLSDISFAGEAIAAGAAADIPVPASESAAVFTTLTGAAGKQKETAKTQAAGLLRKYQVLGGSMSFTEWLDSLIPLSAADLQKKLGDQSAVSAVLGIKSNLGKYKSIRTELDQAVSNPQSKIMQEFKNRMKVDKVFAATQAVEQADVKNTVGSTESEALAIIASQQKSQSFGERIEAGLPLLVSGSLDRIVKSFTHGSFGIGDIIGEDNLNLVESVSDRNIAEMTNRDIAAQTINALRGVNQAVQANTSKAETDQTKVNP